MTLNTIQEKYFVRFFFVFFFRITREKMNTVSSKTSSNRDPNTIFIDKKSPTLNIRFLLGVVCWNNEKI